MVSPVVQRRLNEIDDELTRNRAEHEREMEKYDRSLPGTEVRHALWERIDALSRRRRELQVECDRILRENLTPHVVDLPWDSCGQRERQPSA